MKGQRGFKDGQTGAVSKTAPVSKDLPPGWRWVRLGDLIAEAQPGFASGERDPQGVIQLRMNNVGTRGNLIWDDFIRVPTDQKAVAKYQLQNGDVVFNNTNSVELVGKSALFHDHLEPVVYSNHFTRLRVISEKLDSAYLAAWLLEQWQSRVFENLCNRWIGQSAVKNDKLLALEIPIPPLSEQKRIATILSEQLAAVEHARAAAEAQLQAAKALPAAYLREVFESEEARGWERRTVSGLCDRIDYGFTASANFSIKEPRFLRITDIQDGRVDWDAVPGCQISPKEEEANSLEDGDIVFARTGATTGKSFLIRQPPRAVFASYLIRLRPKNEILADYMYAYFQSDGYWQQIRASARGGAQPNVNAKLLGEIVMPVASPDTQSRIVSNLKEQMNSVEQTRQALESQLAAIEQLPAALLRRAMRGEV